MIAAIALLAALAGPSPRFERTLIPGQRGANRLDVDVTLLGAASPLRYTVTTERGERRFVLQGGLEDLRLHDASGREVQYLVIPPPTTIPTWRSASLLPIPATKTASGFEADLGSIIPVDRIAIRGIDAPFLKRLRLDGSGDRAHWTVLAAEATIFDLPEQQLQQTEIAFSPGKYRYLRAVWDDRSSARITRVGRVAARRYDQRVAPASIDIHVPFRKRASEAGRSRYRLSLPAPHLPIIAVELHVADANVFRDASVSEPRLDGSTLVPVEIGTAKLRRAQREGGVAADMSVPISFPDGPDLDLAVDDGNGEPLTISSITAKFAPLPWIYFESADGAPITASYGEASLHAPRYDLEASRRAVERLRPAMAKWFGGTVTARNVSAPPPLPIGGGPLDQKAFRYSRPVGLLPRGLISLVLDADVLARSASLADVRLVDSAGKQVPYLVEKRDAPLTITLLVPARVTRGTVSVYRLDVPYDTLPAGTRLVITTSGRVFDRDVTLQRPADESHGRGPEAVGRSQWRSADPESSPPSLSFTAPATQTHALELLIDEADNAPLPIASAQLLLPSYAVRFISSGARLTLLYGNPSATAPRYDLALLAPQLISESAREVALRPFTAQPQEQPPRSERLVFWIVIAAATLVLLVTLSRLLATGVSATDL